MGEIRQKGGYVMRARLLLFVTILGVVIAPPVAVAAMIIWEEVADLKYPRSDPAAVVFNDKINDRIYVLGGNVGIDRTTNLVESYDPTTNDWSPIAPMGQIRAGFPAVVATDSSGQERRFAIGGGTAIGGYEQTPRMETYITETNEWMDRKEMLWPPRHRHAAAVLKNKICVMGGISNATGVSILAVVDVYNPETDTWARDELLQLRTPRHSAS